jgi:hypothetical protein
MKDLYRRIGLSRRIDDRRVIVQCIDRTRVHSPRDAEDAQFVLLDDDRKKLYDRVHGALTQIGSIRANLKLQGGSNWIRHHARDFDLAKNGVESQLRLLQVEQVEEKKAESPRHDPGALFGRFAIKAVIILVVVLLVAAYNGAFKKITATPVVKRSAPLALGTPRSPAAHPTDSALQSPTAEQLRKQRVRQMVETRLRKAGELPTLADIEVIASKIVTDRSYDLPRTGILRSDNSRSALAPLSIITSPGKNYYIKVVDWISKREMLTAFVRGGEPLNVKVPLGQFEIRYAAGKNWYGEAVLFAEECVFSKCDELFDFVETRDGYTGYTVELILQQNGNLSTQQLDESAF